MKSFLGTIVLIAWGVTLVAQPPEPPPLPDRDQPARRMELMAIWKLTEDLQLTEQQAEQFFPRLREHREALNQIEKERREVMRKMLEKVERGEEVTEEEFAASLQTFQVLAQKKLDLQIQFLAGTKDMLTPAQRVKLAVFQERFKQDIQRRLREHHDPRRGKKYHDRRGMW
jgi:Spy/CpxP family protein refolding chaperone